MKKYPNVTVKVSLQRLHELDQARSSRALACSPGPPHLAGNQGYQVDALSS